MKLELIFPTLVSATLLCAMILIGTRRLLRVSELATNESIAAAQAQHSLRMACLQAELDRMAAEKAERAAAEAAGFHLVLTLETGSDAGEVFGRFAEMLDELDEFARASGGNGLKIDTSQSKAELDSVTLRLVPADKAHDVVKQREVVMARSRKLAGVSAVEFAAA